MYFIHRQLLEFLKANMEGLKTKHPNLSKAYWFGSKAFTKISHRACFEINIVNYYFGNWAPGHLRFYLKWSFLITYMKISNISLDKIFILGQK